MASITTENEANTPYIKHLTMLKERSISPSNVNPFVFHDNHHKEKILPGEGCTSLATKKWFHPSKKELKSGFLPQLKTKPSMSITPISSENTFAKNMKDYIGNPSPKTVSEDRERAFFHKGSPFSSFGKLNEDKNRKIINVTPKAIENSPKHQVLIPLREEGDIATNKLMRLRSVAFCPSFQGNMSMDRMLEHRLPIGIDVRPLPLTPNIFKFQKAVRKLVNIIKFHSVIKDIHFGQRTLKEKIYPKLLIMPESWVNLLWICILSCALMFTGFYLPIRFAFYKEVSQEWFICEVIVDVIYFLDIFANFFTAYYNDEHVIICTPSAIAERYLKGWFIIDIISIFPFYWLETENKNAEFLYLNKFLRLVRLGRLSKLLGILDFMSVCEGVQKSRSYQTFLIMIKLNSGIKRLFNAIMAFFLFCHVFACFWFYTARYNDFNPETWLLTLSTVGYSNVIPFTKTEHIVASLFIIVGITFISYSIGTLSSILLTTDSNTQKLKTKLLVLDELALNLRMATNLYYKIRQSIKNNHKTQFYSDMDYSTILDELPPSLRSQLATVIYTGNQLGEIEFFKTQHPNIIQSILPTLKRMIIKEDDCIYQYGDLAEEIYFILEGKIKLASEDDYVFRLMYAGETFGVTEIVEKQDFRNETSIAAEDCTLLVLKKSDYMNILQKFSSLEKELKNLSKEIEAKNKGLLSLAKKKNSRLESGIRQRIHHRSQSSIYNRQYASDLREMIKNFDPLNSSLHLIHETEFEDSDDDYDDSESLKSKYSDSEESDYTRQSNSSRKLTKTKKDTSTKNTTEMTLLSDEEPKIQKDRTKCVSNYPRHPIKSTSHFQTTKRKNKQSNLIWMHGKYYQPEIEKDLEERKMYKNIKPLRPHNKKQNERLRTATSVQINRQLTALHKKNAQRRQSNIQVVQGLLEQVENLKMGLSERKISPPRPRRDVRAGRTSIIDSINWQKQLKMQH